MKLALISLFRKLDLDYLCVTRTAPHHSYRNPAERVMSVLDLGLKSIGPSKREIEDPIKEEAVRKCSSLSEIRELTDRNYLHFCKLS